MIQIQLYLAHMMSVRGPVGQQKDAIRSRELLRTATSRQAFAARPMLTHNWQADAPCTESRNAYQVQGDEECGSVGLNPCKGGDR